MQCKLTEPLGADVLVFELVVRGVGVDHNPLHAVAAELLLLFRQQSQDRQTSHREHARAEKSTGEPRLTQRGAEIRLQALLSLRETRPIIASGMKE